MSREEDNKEEKYDSIKNATIVLNTSSNLKIVKKGLLWHQNDTKRSLRNFFKHKWKQRYFILTNAYLTAFKKRKSKISEMGLFLFRLSLPEIASITLNECLNINGDNLVLWESNSVLNEWYNCINNAKSLCIKEAQLNLPSTDKSSPIIDKKRLSRISVLSSSFDQNLSISSTSSSSQLAQDMPTFPRFGSKFKGVASSQSSHFNTTRLDYHLRPCPFTLSISPSLAQKSLYAQKILSQSPNPTPTHSKLFRPFNKATLPSTNSSFISFATQPRSHSSLKSAASEFSFISLGSTTQTPVSNRTLQSSKSSQSPSHLSLKSDSPPPVPPPRIRLDRNSQRPLSSYFLELAAANSSASNSPASSTNSSSTLPTRNNMPTSPLVMNNNFANHRPNQKRKARMNRIIENTSRNFL